MWMWTLLRLCCCILMVTDEHTVVGAYANSFVYIHYTSGVCILKGVFKRCIKTHLGKNGYLHFMFKSMLRLGDSGVRLQYCSNWCGQNTWVQIRIHLMVTLAHHNLKLAGFVIFWLIDFFTCYLHDLQSRRFSLIALWDQKSFCNRSYRHLLAFR